MKLLRGTIRLIILALVTAFFSFTLMTGKLAFARFPSAKLAWRNRNVRMWACSIVQVLNIKVAVTHKGPEAPFLLVANHLSYMDILVLASQLNCTFIAKSEVARWPVIGSLARFINTIFINRNRKRDVVRAMSETQRLIDSGLGVVLFAEGTSTAGQKVSPFKSSLLELAARQNIPVHYASITYATSFDETSADKSVCWWGDMSFTGHFFRLLQLSGFEARVTYGPEPIVAADRRVLAVRLWAAVSAQFTPVPMH